MVTGQYLAHPTPPPPHPPTVGKILAPNLEKGYYSAYLWGPGNPKYRGPTVYYLGPYRALGVHRWLGWAFMAGLKPQTCP